METYSYMTRSKSTREGRMQQHGELDGYYYCGQDRASGPPPSMQELRSYSTSYVQTPPGAAASYGQDVGKMKKSKSRVASSSSSGKGWSFTSDPELQRKKRVVSYKAYAVEGKMKGSLRKSFRWIKDVVHGLW